MAFVMRQGWVNHIYLMGIDTAGTGLNPTRLTGDQEAENYPSWSPDGKRLAYQRDLNGAAIYIINADGSQLEQLTHFAAPYEAGDTNWSIDGKQIAFEYDINGKKQSDPNAHAEVWTMQADGSDQRSTGVECSDVGCAPRWQPT